MKFTHSWPDVYIHTPHFTKNKTYNTPHYIFTYYTDAPSLHGEDETKGWSEDEVN
jgi:hypothetical protein